MLPRNLLSCERAIREIFNRKKKLEIRSEQSTIVNKDKRFLDIEQEILNTEIFDRVVVCPNWLYDSVGQYSNKAGETCK